MNQIVIEKVGLRSLEHLQQIGQQTFRETFSASNSAENMQTYLAEGFSTGKLTAELQNPHSTFYFAKLGERVIGYLKLNTGPAQTELQEANALEIERIYVLQEFQGRQVGQELFAQAVRVAEQNGAAYVWLGVWEENARAIRFYQKNGFIEFGKHLFKLGDDEQTDILLKRPVPGNK